MVLSFTAVDYEGLTKDLGSSHNRKVENMAHHHKSGTSHIEKLFHQQLVRIKTDETFPKTFDSVWRLSLTFSNLFHLHSKQSPLSSAIGMTSIF